jgi:hypothetical protein
MIYLSIEYNTTFLFINSYKMNEKNYKKNQNFFVRSFFGNNEN